MTKSMFLTAVHGAPLGVGNDGLENPYLAAIPENLSSSTENSLRLRQRELYEAEGAAALSVIPVR